MGVRFKGLQEGDGDCSSNLNYCEFVGAEHPPGQ